MSQNDEMIENILQKRYYQPGESKWEDIIDRVVEYVIPEYEEKEEVRQELYDKLWIPNSPCLMSAGTDDNQLAACFVLPIEDTMDSIFDAVRKSAIVQKSGGGVGYSFSALRSEGATVQSTDGVASGPVSFIEPFNAMTDVIKQGGKRRGANMGVLSVHHPDIEKFITAKDDLTKLNNFNLSVMVTDDFMNAVMHEYNYELREDTGEYVISEYAPRIFDKICEHAWKSGEPGVLFYDAINDNNVMKEKYDIVATNPCGEQPLGPYESCVLASIDISKFYDLSYVTSINTHKLAQVVKHMVYFLNNVIDKNEYPLPEIENATKSTRKIGIGMMGLADLFIKLNCSYGDDTSIEYTHLITKNIKDTAFICSKANNNTEVFPDWSISEHIIGYRNACVTSYAPTGTISMFAGCSSGIEPNFALVYRRSNKVDGELKYYDVIHPLFEEWLNDQSPEVRSDIIEYVVNNNGSLQGCIYANLDEQDRFVISTDIDPYKHVDIQAAVQKNCCSGVSKTIIIPNEFTPEQVGDVIKYAWKKGCKGITVYRYGSRDGEVISVSSDSKMEIEKPAMEIKRPVVLSGETYKMKTGCGQLYITVNKKDGELYEVFIKTGGTGGCQANLDALARMISMCLRYELPFDAITKHLSRVKCDACSRGVADGRSCADIVSKVMKMMSESDDGGYIGGSILPPPPISVKQESGNTCSSCGSELKMESGCWVCPGCGESGCS